MTLEPSLHANLSRYLPGDLLEQLPDSRAMAAAIRRLGSLHQALSSFLPQYIAENEIAHTQDYGELRPGTFMFADVSGFTALSEKLQKHGGREGAEILTDIINDYFATMLEILAKSNGQLLKFAGDALLTFFPASEGEDEAPFAIRTGLRMQRAMMEKFQPIRNAQLTELFGEYDVQLTMSIGISRGKLFEAVVGNAAQRDHVIQGRLPGLAMEAEGAGDRDDVIIDAELQAAYAHLFDTEPAGEGFYRVLDNFGDNLSDYEFVVPRRRRASSALFGLGDENLLEDLRRQLEKLDNVARFVAPEVVNKLAFRGDRIESENRPATVIFAYFTGFADLLDDWGDEQLPLLVSILSRYFGITQRVVASNGGTLTRSDPYQSGAKLLITFGAPVAHPDDPERAVTTALEMHRQLALLEARLQDELPEHLRRPTYIMQRIGITYGTAFAGEVGWRARREYTVMGDDVNLAARLMANGQMGQILISPRVWDRVNPHFETEALPPLMLKGKSKPVQPHLVKASTMSPLSMSITSDTPFVGRDLQLLSLTYALQQAKGPRRRQAFALNGETGTGKTRMAKEVVRAAEKTGFSIAWANCQLRHSQGQSVWAAILFQLLQLEQAKSEQAQRRLLNVRLSELGVADLEVMFSQIIFDTADQPARSTPASPEVPAPASGTSIYDLAQTKSDLRKSGIFGAAQLRMEAEQPASETPLWQGVQKRVSLPDGMVRFLQAFTEQAPTLLIIDDLHQADAPTVSVLERVLTEMTKARLMILVTYEPGTSLNLDIRRAVTVSDLDQDETASLVTRVLEVQEAGPQLRQLMWERTHGRPLFVESLLHVLREDDLIAVSPGRAEITGAITAALLPDDVRQLIVSRIDRLPPKPRSLLQLAAVLGDGFSTDMLTAVGRAEDIPHSDSYLSELVQAQIIEPQPDGTYRFRHGLTLTVVYESLSRLQRQKLHRAAADFWMEQPESDRTLFATAYHLGKSGMLTRAMELISNAAGQAEQDQQIDRAIELYAHALELFPHDESVRKQLERLQNLPASP